MGKRKVDSERIVGKLLQKSRSRWCCPGSSEGSKNDQILAEDVVKWKSACLSCTGPWYNLY